MIVGREYGDIVLFNDRPRLEIRDRHPYSQFPRFVAAGDDTAVIIAEHYDRLVPEIRPEYPFTGAIEAVAIDNSGHRL
jgi:hypothetical protein